VKDQITEKGKSNKVYTVMVISPGAGQMKQHRVSKRKIDLLKASAVLLLGLLVLWTTHVYMKSASFSAGIKLSTENMQLKSELGELQNKVAMLSGTLDRVTQFERKLRTITGLEESHTNVGIGPLSNEEMLIAELERTGPPNEAMLYKLESKGFDIKSVNVKKEMDRLLSESSDREKDLMELTSFLEDQRMQLAHTPAIWPTRGWLTSPFGYRRSSFTGKRKFHEGIDIAAQMGTPITASADGVVVFEGTLSGYGKTLVINHGFDFTTRYAHCSQTLVEAGQKVSRGQKVATVGNTGRSTGPHLHYEVRINGVPQNPMRYIVE